MTHCLLQTKKPIERARKEKVMEEAGPAPPPAMNEAQQGEAHTHDRWDMPNLISRNSPPPHLRLWRRLSSWTTHTTGVKSCAWSPTPTPAHLLPWLRPSKGLTHRIGEKWLWMPPKPPPPYLPPWLRLSRGTLTYMTGKKCDACPNHLHPQLPALTEVWTLTLDRWKYGTCPPPNPPHRPPWLRSSSWTLTLDRWKYGTCPPPNPPHLPPWLSSSRHCRQSHTKRMKNVATGDYKKGLKNCIVYSGILGLGQYLSQEMQLFHVN